MLPLAGLRVVDLGQIYQGPYATFLMAANGAEVIKVEPPGGERLRGLAAGTAPPLAFAMLNASKKSISLDLKHPRGRELLKELVKISDVLLENFAPGVMDRLGVGYQVLKEINPKLIYATGSGYGITGPDRDQLAMDHTIQAASGMMSLTGELGGRPLRSGGAPADIMSGVHLYAGVMTALLNRERTGLGTLVEVAMVESMYFVLASDLASYHRTGQIPQPTGNRTPSLVTPYSIYPCNDGYIAVICVTEDHWLRMADAMGKSEAKSDPRFKSTLTRHEHEKEINDLVNAWTSPQSKHEAARLLREAKVPVAVVRNLEEVRTDAHMHQRGMLEWHDDPRLGRVVLGNSPIRFPELGRERVADYAELGRDNAAIFCELLGVSAEELTRMKQEKVI